MTLDELLADLDREVLRTWGDGTAAADGPSPLETPPDPESAEAPYDAGERCLLLTLPGRRYRRCAVPIGAVVAVNELPPVSAVPFAPPWLRGVTRAAGGVVAVVDLVRLLVATEPSFAAAESADAAAPRPLHGPDSGQAEREILVVVRTSGADLDAGLAVPGIARLVSLAATPRQQGGGGENRDRRSAVVARWAPDPAAGQLPPAPPAPPTPLAQPTSRTQPFPLTPLTPRTPQTSPTPLTPPTPPTPLVAVLDVDQLLRRARQGLGA